MKKFFVLLVITIVTAFGLNVFALDDNNEKNIVAEIFQEVHPGVYGAYKCSEQKNITIKDENNKDIQSPQEVTTCFIKRTNLGERKFRCDFSKEEIIRKIQNGECSFKSDMELTYKCQKGYTTCIIKKLDNDQYHARCEAKYDDGTVVVREKTGEDVANMLNTWWCKSKY